MRFTAIVSALIATSTAFVVPQLNDQELLDGLRNSVPAEAHPSSDGDHGFWDHLPSKTDFQSAFDDAIEAVESVTNDGLHAIEDFQTKIRDDLSDAFDIASYHPGHHKHGHDQSNLTIYELIHKSNYTQKFAKAVDEFPNIVELLNSTKANYTLFVPINEAFEDLPEGDKKPSKEFIEQVLLYHVGLGKYPVRRILGTHTLPTALNEHSLGDEPQRLRVGVGLTGVKVNFYAKIIAADFVAKNGVVHVVRNIIVPPPPVGPELALFPSGFSTLLLAYEKTNFVDYIHHVKLAGSTVFAPSNNAFSSLGLKANAFLFNTETGLKYLKAILKYHIAPNATLYSDAFYDKTHGSSLEPEGFEREHYDLATLLGDTHVAVDIARYGAFLTYRVNAFSSASVTDGISKNGVIQVLNRVLIPPHNHKVDETSTEGIEVEDLMDRLEPYLE